MFLLANKFSLPHAPESCFLSGSAGFSDTPGIAWHLKLHSASLSISTPESDQGYLAFGIDCSRLHFDVADWRELRGASLEAPEKSLACAFQVVCWEDLLSLRLSFGEVRGNEIEVSAEGVGLVESAPDLFGHSETGFSIRTSARFRGVSINVPVNAANFTDYAQETLRTLLPAYEHGQPIVRHGTDGETLRGVEVFYPPS